MKRRYSNLASILILVSAVVLRSLILIYIGFDEPDRFYLNDSVGYVRLAENLLDYGVFSQDLEPPLSPDLIRTPGYPLMLAAVFGVSGTEVSVVALQIVLGGLTALAVRELARELKLSLFAQLGAAFLVAVEPVSGLLSNLLLSETLFTLLLVVGLWLFVRYWQRGGVYWLIASAAVLALATLTRPIAQFLPLALLPFLVAKVGKERLRTVVTRGLVFLLIGGLIVSTWSWRNYRANGVFTLSRIAERNFLHYRARAVVADVENISQGAALEKLMAEIDETATRYNLTPGEKMALQRQRAFEIFWKYPGPTAKMMASGAVRLFADPGYALVCTMLDLTSVSFECFPGKATTLESNIVDKAIGGFLAMTLVQQATLAWSVLLLGALYCGGGVGVVHLVRRRNWMALALPGIVILYFVVLSSGAETSYRFRAPIVPFLAILAGAGYGMLAARWRKPKAKE